MKPLVIDIDVSDWRDEFLRNELTLESEDDIVACVVEEGFTTGEVARMTEAARAMGIIPDDVVKPPRAHLYLGARSEVTQLVAKRKREAIMPNGRTYMIREYVGLPGRPPHDDDEDENAGDGDKHGFAADREAVTVQEPEEDLGDRPFVDSMSEYGVKRMVHSLLNGVQGWISNRLTTIAAAGGDVEDVAEQVKAEIDAIVERLVGEE